MSMNPGPPTPPMMPGSPMGGNREAPGGTAGLVLGICSLVFGGMPFVGLILGWIGYVKSRDAKRICEMAPGAYSNYGVAQAGYICSIIGICLGALMTLCMCGYFIIVIGIVATGAAGAAGAMP